MMNFKANFAIVNFTTGENNFPMSANTSNIHQVHCVTAGDVTINALGGGSVTLSMIANDTIDVVTRSVNVVSGEFIGFKISNQSQPHVGGIL